MHFQRWQKRCYSIIILQEYNDGKSGFPWCIFHDGKRALNALPWWQKGVEYIPTDGKRGFVAFYMRVCVALTPWFIDSLIRYKLFLIFSPCFVFPMMAEGGFIAFPMLLGLHRLEWINIFHRARLISHSIRQCSWWSYSITFPSGQSTL